MGNKLCKRKSDVVDNPKSSQTPFVRIINRLHLRPKAWKSETHLNQKQASRKMIKVEESNHHIINNKSQSQLSKSSDWTDVELEVPESESTVHLRNPKLSSIFDNSITTPTPPPRKHKKGIREKLETVAKNSFQAFQNKKPVDEPLCVKKIVKHSCPLDDHDCAIHNHRHKHRIPEDKKLENNEKRRKNLSVVSLPNYNDLKLTVATFDDKHLEQVDAPAEPKKENPNKSMPRCRSFGSLLPQQLLTKLKVRKVPSEAESDDSFGPLEDWDLRLIEHYNPKEASLPRPPKLDNKPPNPQLLSGIESLIVSDEEAAKPVAPARRSESFVKKINREAARKSQELGSSARNQYRTPPSTPEDRQTAWQNTTAVNDPATQEKNSDVVEHSSLMRILEEFSIKDKQQQQQENNEDAGKNAKPVELDTRVKSIEDFLHSEKVNSDQYRSDTTVANEGKSKT